MSNISVKIKRFEWTLKQTLGELMIKKQGIVVYACKTLELAWNGNEKQKSCIPPGRYDVKKRYSTKYKDHFHVLDVPNRSYILIHQGNYYADTLGCILVGKEHSDIDGDGERDVTSSRNTMNELNNILPDSFKLKIV